MEGDHVLAFARRYEKRHLYENVYECGKELPMADVVSHEGLVEYHNFGFHVRLFKPDDSGVISRRMDEDCYHYQVKV